MSAHAAVGSAAPTVLRGSRWPRALLFAFYTLMFLFYAYDGGDRKHPMYAVVLIGSICAAFTLIACIRTLRTAVILGPHELVSRNLFRTWRMPRDQVAEFRVCKRRRDRSWLLFAVTPANTGVWLEGAGRVERGGYGALQLESNQRVLAAWLGPR